MNLGFSEPPTRTDLELMVHALSHRGPDGFGYFNDEQVGLGHARLSIIDLATGHQPIHDARKRVWTVFNGEIFNFVELRAQLIAQGYEFYTQSDTEVIVHLYDRFGTDFVHHLNGQFAIAIWDKDRRRLILARDRVGIRPLFYAQIAGRLIFGSEIKSLLALQCVPASLDPGGLADVFTYWSCIGSATVFKGIRALPPGHVAVADQHGLAFSQYWDWEFPDAPISTSRSVDDLADELRALVVDSVRLQLRADVPVGAYLSGGLDSSIVCALIRDFTSVPLRTFSLGFEDAEFDESDRQTEMVHYLKGEHTAIACAKQDIANSFRKVIWHTECPILRTAPVPLMLLSGAVRAAGYKVVLTGEGADEVFGGYDLFKEAKIRRFWARNPASRFRPRILQRLYPYLKHSPSSNQAFSQRFFGQNLGAHCLPYFAHLPRWSTTRRAWQFFSAELRARIGDREDFSEFAATLPFGMDRWSALHRDQYVEAKTLLPGYLLSSQGDRMTMANSVEGRYPFLDHRVIEFANRLPAHLKLRGLAEKYLLRRSMKGYLPETIRLRPKQPYRAPESSCFFAAGETNDLVSELLSPSRLKDAGYFEPVAVGRLTDKCRSGRAIGFADNMAFVGILSTMMLDDLLVRRRSPSSG
jgi:asparagine synthase (glutamine-hydrolysing)